MEAANFPLLRCRKSHHSLDAEHVFWRFFDRRIGHHHNDVPAEHAVGPHPLCKRCVSDEQRIATRKLEQRRRAHAHK